MAAMCGAAPFPLPPCGHQGTAGGALREAEPIPPGVICGWAPVPHPDPETPATPTPWPPADEQTQISPPNPARSALIVSGSHIGVAARTSLVGKSGTVAMFAHILGVVGNPALCLALALVLAPAAGTTVTKTSCGGVSHLEVLGTSLGMGRATDRYRETLDKYRESLPEVPLPASPHLPAAAVGAVNALRRCLTSCLGSRNQDPSSPIDLSTLSEFPNRVSVSIEEVRMVWRVGIQVLLAVTAQNPPAGMPETLAQQYSIFVPPQHRSGAIDCLKKGPACAPHSSPPCHAVPLSTDVVETAGFPLPLDFWSPAK